MSPAAADAGREPIAPMDLWGLLLLIDLLMWGGCGWWLLAGAAHP